jgi:hypothetical protein
MKVVEQLIRFFEEKGELSAEQLDLLIRRGFLIREPAPTVEDLFGDDDSLMPVAGDLDTCQGELEGGTARKGKKPATGQGKVVRRSFRRWWRAHIAAKKRERLRARLALGKEEST